jgi:hypothetical protein
MGPKGARGVRFWTVRDPRPCMVNFLGLLGEAGVAQISAAGQLPAVDVLKVANTMGRATVPAATASRGTATPSIEVEAALAAGSRAASAAARSTTQPTTAMDSNGNRLMPRPWISIRPLSACAGRTSNLPDWPNSSSRSSPTRRANGSNPCDAALMSDQASKDLPEPDGPRMRTALDPARTAEAWMVESAAIRSREGAR